MTVTAQTPFTEYIAAPGATTFATTFRLIELGDLVVTVNGATVTSGFAVGGLPLGPTASVVFTVPMVGGEAVKLRRVVKLARENNYQFEGDFQANVVNEDFDRLWMSQQEQELQIDENEAAAALTNLRNLRAPIGEVLPEMSNAAARANKLQAFNSAGDPIYVLPGTGTASDVLIQLANQTNSALGASLIGYKNRTLSQRLNDFVSIKDFNAFGDGISDDLVALTAFFNSANSLPGIPHILDSKTYAVSAILPTINKSNVKIIGQGTDIHDAGPLMTGTVLRWIGPAIPTGSLAKIAAESGVNNQRISNIEFTGIGIDCNSGAIGTGLEALSIRDSVIDVAVANAGFAGVKIGVVSSLAEAKDVQKCTFNIKSRQLEKRNAFCLLCQGDSIANVSLNEFSVDAQITDAQAIYLTNSDNNDWRSVRIFQAGGGTATEGVSCLGGVTDSTRCRGERFHYYTSQLPIHVYGTSGLVSYAFASTGHSLFCLDTENGSPPPIVEVGGQINWRKDVSGMTDNSWTEYTPVIGAQTGVIGTATAKGSYIRRGNIIYIKLQISIVTNGTASGFLTASMPFGQVGTIGTSFIGQERAITGKGLHGFLDGGGSTTLIIRTFDGMYPGGSGATLETSGFYQTT